MFVVINVSIESISYCSHTIAEHTGLSQSSVLLHSENSVTYYFNVKDNLIQYFFLSSNVVNKMFCNQVRLNN